MDSLNKRIDSLNEAKDVADLADRLQKILGQVAYYVSQSEGATLEVREKWHDDYTDALYSDGGKAAPNAGNAKPAEAGADHAARIRNVNERRAKPDDLPASLRAILNGSG